MRFCYVSHNYKHLNSAGNKAKSDIETIMQQRGFCNVGLPQTSYNNTVLHFLVNLAGILCATVRLRRGDVLLLQYPLKKYYAFLCNVAHARGAKVITVIHDLNSLRARRLTQDQERRRLNHSDVIIAHNEKMVDYLKQIGCEAPMTTIGIFDYLSPEPTSSTCCLPDGSKPLSVFWLGSLSPKNNRFLYDLGPRLGDHELFLYGNGWDEELAGKATNTNTHCLGFAKDFDLMNYHCGDFGLSWYGESLQTGVGKIGEYMAYNNPHKVSLYLRCEVPVIVWRHAGIAKFVEEEGIGILVDDLETLPDVLASVTREQYNEMIFNVDGVGVLISDGYYFSSAFDRAVELLK